MNWGSQHWVALCIDLSKGHIDILDPFEACTPLLKVVSYMSPLAQMLPQLVSSVCGTTAHSQLWPLGGFSFTRLTGVAQSTRPGNCGALCVKFMELHSHYMYEALHSLTNDRVETIRLQYAIDLFAAVGGKI